MAKNGSKRSEQGNWTSTQAYIMAVICLLIGITVGYLVRGSISPATPAVQAGGASSMPGGTGQVTPDQLKHVADKEAEPLLRQLQSSPNDPALLANIGNVYYDAQQYRDAISYYDQSLKIDAKNPNVRTDMGTAYYYLGDPDTAIREFETALRYDPNHGQTMFNLGMVKWQGKGDAKGALKSWEKLLQVQPNYPDRPKVEQLIAQARQHMNIEPGTKTDKPVM